MAFLFIWQFILSGPLELASGYIGFGKYMSYIWHGMTPWQSTLVAMAAGTINILVLFRGISSIGKLSVALWITMLATVACVIGAGLTRFDASVAFDFPPDALRLGSSTFWFGLGAAGAFGIYDYLGYYNICFIGEEIRNPGRIMPRAIITSLIAVALIYLLMNLAIIGSIPWREFVPASEDNPVSNHLVSVLIERTFGPRFAIVFTVLVLVTIYASAFAALLAYSRIAFAAARDGYFFSPFAWLHPRLHFPHVSLVVIGVISVLACLLPLGTVIGALMACRILIQFVGQIFAVVLLRSNRPDMPRPYRIWFYPFPLILAFVGWIFVFATSGTEIIVFGLGMLLAGVVAFLIWARITRRWPMAVVTEALGGAKPAKPGLVNRAGDC
jgi:amino acid transporter